MGDIFLNVHILYMPTSTPNKVYEVKLEIGCVKMLHEEDKFKEWAGKVEIAINSKYYRLRYFCERMLHWANKIKELDNESYVNNIKGRVFSLILKALPIIYDDYYDYLIDSHKHGKYAKIRQKK